MDMEEYRLLNGWSKDRKRGSSRYDRIPTNLKQEIYINNRKDYQYFLPDNLQIEFTTADFSKQAKISKKQAQIVIHILNYVGVIKKIGKKSSFILYGKNI